MCLEASLSSAASGRAVLLRTPLDEWCAGPADVSGLIHPNDEIHTVNHVPVHEMAHDQVFCLSLDVYRQANWRLNLRFG